MINCNQLMIELIWTHWGFFIKKENFVCFVNCHEMIKDEEETIQRIDWLLSLIWWLESFDCNDNYDMISILGFQLIVIDELLFLEKGGGRK